jgi:tetratricopeptide (TPR) repeat protein
MPTRPQQAHVASLALQELRTAISHEKNPSADVFRDLGAALESLQQTTLAIEAYTGAIERAPERAELYVSRGWARVAVGAVPAARDDFDRAAKLRAEYAEALAGRAFCAAQSADAPAAERDAAAALAAGGGDYLVLHNVACVYAQLSADSSAPRDQTRANEDLAISLIGRALRLWRAAPTGPDELRLIEAETAFPNHMKEREEFKALIERRDGTK